MSVDNAYRILFLGALVWFGLLLLIMLIMAVTTKSDLKPGDDEKSTAKKNRGKK